MENESGCASESRSDSVLMSARSYAYANEIFSGSVNGLALEIENVHASESKSCHASESASGHASESASGHALGCAPFFGSALA